MFRLNLSKVSSSPGVKTAVGHKTEQQGYSWGKEERKFKAAGNVFFLLFMRDKSILDGPKAGECEREKKLTYLLFRAATVSKMPKT